MTLDWTAIGTALRESALDAHDGKLPPVEVAYSFLLDNPEIFLADNPEFAGFPGEEPNWPADIPQEPNIELITAYYAAYQDDAA
jgi:hypothetical protein